MPPSKLHLGTPPMRATITQNQTPAFHGILKCNLPEDQFDPMRIQIGGRQKPPIMMCMAQGMSNSHERYYPSEDVLHLLSDPEIREEPPQIDEESCTR